ncbi:MAG: lipid A biosynthesis acyltransferase [Chlorobi bacterium]|nr:lipid A biosynthesis acyltransferase [Chlorobiota bacterium]
MSSWKGKTRGGLAGYRFFIFLLKYPGLKFSYFFLRLVVLYFVLFAPKARNPIYWYFRNIHYFGPLKSVRYLFKNFYALGKVLLDKVALLSGFSARFTFDFEGEKYLHQMASEEGGFLIGAHIGNWEIAGQLLERIDTKVHILMVEAEHERIKALLDNVMVKKKIDIIAMKDDLSHLIEIKKALDNNEIVALHGDRFVEGAKTITGKLMGREALFPFGPFFLALKYNRPVTFVSAVKETDTHYHFYATRPRKYSWPKDPAGRKKQQEKILADYTSEMERILKKYPEQWFNYYYFWDIPNN